jgi:hypothetical protein
MNRLNILKISLPILFFIVFFNFSSSQDLSGSNISVNIEWQTLDSYIPTFYEGRALPGEEAYMKALAIVDANSVAGSINTDNLYYSWKYNDYYVYTYSGTGMKTIYFTLDQLQSTNTLELDVYSDSSQTTMLGKKIINISPIPSLPILYKKSDNNIITYANAINKKYQDFQVNSGDSFNILAEPYFFSAKNTLDPVLSYSWTADGVFNGNIGSNIFNYFAGSVNSLDLKITNGQKILQEGEALINFSVNQ